MQLVLPGLREVMAKMVKLVKATKDLDDEILLREIQTGKVGPIKTVLEQKGGGGSVAKAKKAAKKKGK